MDVQRYKDAIRAILRSLVAGEINEVQAVAKIAGVAPFCRFCGGRVMSPECSSCIAADSYTYD